MQPACESGVTSTPLPDDTDALKRLVVRRDAELLEARLMVEKLKLARYKREKFGASSERLTQLAQLELLVEELETQREALTDEPSASTTEPAPIEPAQRRPARKPLPDHLPRETLVHSPEHIERCACDGCGGVLRLLGQDVAEVLEIVPARFKVIRHVRPKYSCSKCQTITQAAAPSRPIARGLAGPGLLAHVMVSKFADDGRIEMDNNAAEREIRAVALGRKNWLFAGSDAGGDRAAAMYSLIGSAKLNGLDPQAYLRHVIERIADHPVNRVDELLPWNVADAIQRSNVDQRLAA